MSNVFTLEALQAEIEQTYAPLVFQAGNQEFVLQSLMMVDAKVRKAVQERLKTITTDQDEDGTLSEEDTVESLKFILSSVTKDKAGAALIRVLGNEIVVYTTLLQKWMESTQPGEASSSPS